MRIEPTATDDAVLSELGRRIADTRLARNVSQQELADEAGVGVATLQRLERGDAVALVTAIRVLRALGMLSALEAAVPEPLPSPVEQLRLRGRRRRRATGGRRRGVAETELPWAWGGGAGSDGE